MDRPVGAALPGWRARPSPPRTAMAGRYCRVEPLDPARHAASLFAAYGDDADGGNWTYLPLEPFADPDLYRAWLEQIAAGDDPLFHAVIDGTSGAAVGIASDLRIDRGNGVIEIGHINFSPRLQRRRAASEALMLMIARAFDELGYRRCEWKCDSLNAPSRAAAERLGFRFEGIFHQAVVTKGRNRDTAWYAMLDGEWTVLAPLYRRWLDPANFDAAGRQRESLSALVRAAER